MVGVAYSYILGTAKEVSMSALLSRQLKGGHAGKALSIYKKSGNVKYSHCPIFINELNVLTSYRLNVFFLSNNPLFNGLYNFSQAFQLVSNFCLKSRKAVIFVGSGCAGLLAINGTVPPTTKTDRFRFGVNSRASRSCLCSQPVAV